jgi:hypothetical protein
MYSIVPTSVLRTWPAPNYVDPPTRGPEFYIVCGIFLGLATVLLFVRLYARLFVRRWFGLDDALIIFSWVSCLRCSLVQTGRTSVINVFHVVHHHWECGDRGICY